MIYNKEIDDPILIQSIILHTLNKADCLLAYGDMLNVVLNNCNINFSDFQLALDNLVQTNHIEGLMTGKNIQKFRITEKGLNVVEFFRGKIPVYIREPIEESIKQLLYDERIKNAVRGKISAVSPTEYTAECALYDGDNTMLMEISLYTGTRDQAEAVVKHFKKNSDKVYAKIIEAFSPDAE